MAEMALTVDEKKSFLRLGETSKFPAAPPPPGDAAAPPPPGAAPFTGSASSAGRPPAGSRGHGSPAAAEQCPWARKRLASVLTAIF